MNTADGDEGICVIVLAGSGTGFFLMLSTPASPIA